MIHVVVPSSSDDFYKETHGIEAVNLPAVSLMFSTAEEIMGTSPDGSSIHES